MTVMDRHVNRRQFLARSTTGAAIVGMGDLSFLPQLTRLKAADLALPPDAVTFRPEIEPLVQLLEKTDRSQVIETFAERIKAGTSYRDILSALLLAGIRNIQPRPVGFKFHAVLVVNSAHLASLNSPSDERWLPIFWALDYFKDSQARDVREGDWTMKDISNSRLPTPDKARQAFREAIESWDVEATDLATASLARTAGAGEILNLFSRYGCRDYRDIGHKAIYVANSWRTLQTIGWEHSEPVLRSLAYALLAHNGANPSTTDHAADRAGKENLRRLEQFRPGWQKGRLDHEATLQLAGTFRQNTDLEASAQALELINHGIDPQSVWDAVFNFAGELLRRHPGIVSLHAITSANALHFSFQHCGDENTRKLLLLQACAFMPRFRGQAIEDGMQSFQKLEPSPVSDNVGDALEDIFGTIDSDRPEAAAKVFQYLESGLPPREFISTARRFLFLKGSNSHDYKFTSAVLEDFYHVSPRWRNHYLAASVFNLRGSKANTNQLVDRIASAMS